MLPSSNRLPKQDISRVMRSGVRVTGNSIVLLYKKTTGSSRFAFIVSTKVDKRATVRNRIRRIVSESVRHLLPRIPSTDGIVIVHKNIAGLTQLETEKMVTELLVSAKLL